MIRIANFDDIPKLIELKTEVARDTYLPLGTEEQFSKWVGIKCSSEYFSNLIGNHSTILVAEYKSEFLGMASISFKEDHCYFGDHYVGLRGRNIGYQLTQNRLALAKNHFALQEPDTSFDICAKVFYNNVVAYKHLLKHGFLPYDWELSKEYGFPLVKMKQTIFVPHGEI